ncbi:MAG: CpXC domain-containing protein [Caldilinea sp.]
MSGILLPGQDKQPSSGSGIELPKGFSRRREETEPVESPTVEEAPVSTESTEAASEATPARPRRPGEDLLFPPTGAQVQCPNCGTPYAVPVFTIIDLGVNPELGPAILGGQINMAMCPQCGAGGPLGAPLMVHEPAHEFLGVYVPPTGIDDMQRQRIIGDLTQTLMRRLPTEARRGYMLQPKEYLDWNRFVEKLWEFQGVTPEMLRRQRDQATAIQSLARLADDPGALDIALERYRSLIDRQFFSLIERLMMLSGSQGDRESLLALQSLRQALLEKTDAGREIKVLQERVEQTMRRIQPNATREEVLDILLDAWGEEGGEDVVPSVALSLAPMLDYQFLLAIAERLEHASDPVARDHLEKLREIVLAAHEQQQAMQQDTAAQAQQVLQAVLEATDAEAALRENADMIDENFLGLLAANIQRAEQNKAAAAAKRLRRIYDLALGMMQQQMSPELRLINDLLSASDQKSQRKLLEENRALLNRDFVEALKQLENDFRQRQGDDIADRLKSIRAQTSLML